MCSFFTRQVLFLMRYFWYICIKTAHVVYIRHRALVSGVQVHLAYIYLFGLVISSIIFNMIFTVSFNTFTDFDLYSRVSSGVIEGCSHTFLRSHHHDKVFVKQVWLVNVMFICGYMFFINYILDCSVLHQHRSVELGCQVVLLESES